MARKKKKTDELVDDVNATKETDTKSDDIKDEQTPTDESKVEAPKDELGEEKVEEKLSDETDPDPDIPNILDGSMANPPEADIIDTPPVLDPIPTAPPVVNEPKKVLGDTTMANAITSYLALVQGSDIKRSATAFAMIFRALLTKTTAENVKAVYDMFITHKNDILHESKALQGVTVLQKALRAKVELAYGVFREITTTNKQMDIERIRKVLGESFTNEIVKLSKKK